MRIFSSCLDAQWLLAKKEAETFWTSKTKVWSNKVNIYQNFEQYIFEEIFKKFSVYLIDEYFPGKISKSYVGNYLDTRINVKFTLLDYFVM